MRVHLLESDMSVEHIGAEHVQGKLRSDIWYILYIDSELHADVQRFPEASAQNKLLSCAACIDHMSEHLILYIRCWPILRTSCV